MIDYDILNLCTDKDNYNRFMPFIKDHMVSPTTMKILHGMKDFHTINTGTWDWNSFGTWFKIVKGNTDPLLNMVISKATSKPAVKAVEKAIVESLLAKDYSARIADKALSISEGSTAVKMEDVEELISKYNNEIDKSSDLDSLIVTSDVEKLLEMTSTKNGLRWRIPNLNEAIGPIKKGDFIVVGSRPDSGKTSFLASEATHLVKQLKEDQTVLWINNEEASGKVKMRTLQAGTGWSDEKMRSVSSVDVVNKYKKEVGELTKIIIIEDDSCDVNKIEALIKRNNAGLIVIDQLAKVPSFTKEAGQEVMRQGMLYNWARSIAKKHAPVIAVHQAGGQWEGERWLPSNCFYGSQTSIAGEADVIITIGRSRDPKENDMRFFWLPKNKMIGSNHMVKNGRFIAEINTKTGRFNTDGTFISN